ncbi:hypothetical protein SPSIL_005150 [Sporomusa silvacetica DSM 10669]|uniref:Uncharacterized protein n=1 Tax=Sporomusa silvacetica DSM 10669 TaxID=1123289 RepID=A0ABZ3IGB1_9FIRM|nr:hypothetical protein SPSIL_01980 [Sporomusa silvacetica DSM 10669]
MQSQKCGRQDKEICAGDNYRGLADVGDSVLDLHHQDIKGEFINRLRSNYVKNILQYSYDCERSNLANVKQKINFVSNGSL